MMDPANFALFVGISWALMIAPGPDMLLECGWQTSRDTQSPSAGLRGAS